MFAAYAFHYALVAGAQKALVADLVPAAVPRARLRHLPPVLGLTLLPASALFGLLYQRFGAPVAFSPARAWRWRALLLPLSRVRGAVMQP